MLQTGRDWRNRYNNIAYKPGSERAV